MNRDYNDPLYKKWRLDIFRRDKFQCQKCKSKRNIQAHHIQGWSKCPELRFDLSNGITLCKRCHGEMRGNEEGWEPLCRALQNKDQYIKVKMLLRKMRDVEE